jgi:hypothetical protein
MRRGPAAVAALFGAVLIPAATADRPSWAQAPFAQWTPAFHMTQVVDLTPPRSDRRLVVSANGRLWLMAPGGRPRPWARGKGGYKTSIGPEAYVALSPGQAVRAAHCRFPRQAVAGLDPNASRVVMVTRDGRSRVLARMPGAGLIDGIAFDEPGRFGHRLLVTKVNQGRTALFAIDCRGRVRKLARTDLALEGGMNVAPMTFAPYAGQLIITDEYSGQIHAFAPDGHRSLVFDPGLPSGQDTGVESTGFVPPGFGAGWSAYVADRAKQPPPFTGDDQILTLDGGALVAAGVRAGDLLVAGEGASPTVAIRCEPTCVAQHVADGPATAHTEGHIVFARQ